MIDSKLSEAMDIILNAFERDPELIKSQECSIFRAKITTLLETDVEWEIETVQKHALANIADSIQKRNETSDDEELPPEEDVISASELESMAQDCYDKKESLRLLSRALSMAPCARLWTKRGNIHLCRKEYRRAEQDAARALELNPNYAKALVLRATTNFKQGVNLKCAFQYICTAQSIDFDEDALGLQKEIKDAMDKKNEDTSPTLNANFSSLVQNPNIASLMQNPQIMSMAQNMMNNPEIMKTLFGNSPINDNE